MTRTTSPPWVCPPQPQINTHACHTCKQPQAGRDVPCRSSITVRGSHCCRLQRPHAQGVVGTAARGWRTCASKPRSKQRSTSSTTRSVTRCRSHAWLCTRSIMRPGVATATSEPPCSSRTCPCFCSPPNAAQQRRWNGLLNLQVHTRRRRGLSDALPPRLTRPSPVSADYCMCEHAAMPIRPFGGVSLLCVSGATVQLKHTQALACTTD